jgi:hypothetical protein
MHHVTVASTHVVFIGLFREENVYAGQKKKLPIFDSLSISVIPLGLEPRAPTLKVLCSTN